MILDPTSSRLSATLLLALALAAAGIETANAQPPIVQPGRPGEPSRQISADEASDLASLEVTDADVKFMHGMIAHHAQALQMTELLTSRSQREVMHRLAERIALSQEDEISMMEAWLRARDQVVPEPDAHPDPGARMPGMLTEAEMARLADARGLEFDRLFLTLMIKHHRGALTMVETLLDQRGAAQDPQLFAFTSEITADQGIEIDRMDTMLAELTVDPRVNLAPGFRDAGQASWNLELVTSLPKPDGFYDPRSPAGARLARRAGREGAGGDQQATEEESSEERPARPGLLSFANTDLAFAGTTLFEGNYHGFSAYDIENPSSPQLLSSVVCPGGQGDVSVIGNLLILSVEQQRGRLDCGLQGVAEPVSQDRFRGLRVFDISDVRFPRQVAAVQTCRGSHTHTLVTDPDDVGQVYVYGSGTSAVRSGEELEGCSDESPAENPDTALFRIDIIRIPLAHPEEARIVGRPFIFADPQTGTVAGLWRGGDHGPGTQSTRETNQCHDITAYPEIGLAAGACSGNGILLDISDPVNPVRIDQVVDPGFAYWHSATFNNDGTKVIFTDEWGGGGRPRCRASDPREWGANAIFDVVDRRLQFRAYFKLPAPQTEQENCVAHNGSLVPVPGRDILVQAWYQGGVSVIDFTDSANPVEVAYFDRGPIDAEDLVMGGYWSAYWYRGFIYGTEIARGLDVFRVLPSDFLTDNEIDAAALVAPETFNPQQQRRIAWPARPVVARAYLDQLHRTGTLDEDRVTAVRTLLDRAGSLLTRPDGSPRPVAEADAIVAELEAVARIIDAQHSTASGRTQARLRALATTLIDLADAIR